VQEDSPLIVALKKAYQTVVGEEAEVLTKGGASYARTLKNGVAFGATFEGEDPKPHMPNEQMPVESLLKACEIYVHAFIGLAGK
ncbi:MAG TPA: M20/M25/M40 family metallo-hydrolase, partial [Candidatus Jeotgalibaca pullicola]|nr:M20/M25/M40 family metallo-hydrolase [Candidatus Jeotgalibaca pullicola]